MSIAAKCTCGFSVYCTGKGKCPPSLIRHIMSDSYEIKQLKEKINEQELIIYGQDEGVEEWKLKCSNLEYEVSVIRERTINECQNMLLNQLQEVFYANGYAIRAAPQADILALPALMKLKS